MDDIDAFFYGPGRDNSRTFQLIRRLHIIHKDHVQEPTYLDLTRRNLWAFVGRLGPINQADLLVENGTYATAALDLLELDEDQSLMPRLERVVMGGIRKSLWTTYSFGYEYGAYDRRFAHVLIDLPSVKHYCQSVQVGPLSLPSGLLALDTPLETFTHHAVPGHGPSPHLGGMPPVVIGAINRYYFSCNHTLVSMDGLDPLVSDKELFCILLLILQMYHKSVVLPARDTEPDHPNYGITTEAAQNTTIEVYDFIRHVRIHPPEVRPPWPFYHGKALELADRPAESLEMVQETLERLMQPEWKGRVRLKNREEAPPCAACDLDPKEQWKVPVLLQDDNPSSVYLLKASLDDHLQDV